MFRHLGIDYDIKHKRRAELNYDHALLHAGYYRLKRGQKWGDWTLDRIARYHAKIVGTLRKMGYEYPVAKEGLKRELDLLSRKYEGGRKMRNPVLRGKSQE